MMREREKRKREDKLEILKIREEKVPKILQENLKIAKRFLSSSLTSQ